MIYKINVSTGRICHYNFLTILWPALDQMINHLIQKIISRLIVNETNH